MKFWSKSVIDKLRAATIRCAPALAVEVHASSAVLEYSIVVPTIHKNDSEWEESTRHKSQQKKIN